VSILFQQSYRTLLVKANLIFVFLMMASLPCPAPAQENQPPAPLSNDSSADLKEQVRELRTLVEQLQKQVSDLQIRVPATPIIEKAGNPPSAQGPAPKPPTQEKIPVTESTSNPLSAQVSAPAPPAQEKTEVRADTSQNPPTSESQKVSDLLHGTTVNLLLDGYYEYNFNAPIGRANLLRAYDVSSNAFSLNQADLVLENAPDPSHGKRFGVRLDLQYGQATETLQGNPANEPRPEIYRAVFQAFGTYVIPIGRGLNVDFGKWASSLGIEGNYTKDQMNYSRSYWFNFLPFYHMGVRAQYPVNDKLSVNYWVVNGTQWTEPFNGFKDELFGVNVQPRKSVSWTSNYYLGQEHPDFQYEPIGTPGLPTQQGIPFEPIPNPAKGKLNIIDNYVTWNASPRLTLALEGDYVIERLQPSSPPDHTDGGAAYVRYQIRPKIALAARSEYMSDHGGLFSGTTQALKETTLTFEYKFTDNFVMREEWRRDFSNQPFFLTDTLGILRKQQTTVGIGLVWWFGGKQGAW
jgi:hypothetical protein